MRKAIICLIFVLFIITPFFPVLAYNPNYRFTDQEKDNESGLYNFDARQYNPSIGRFIQPDPVMNNLTNPQKLKEITRQDLQELLKDPQNLNPYGYSRNNPIKYVDPEGEFNFETNEVEKGDTLYGVFGENWKEVSNFNNLKNPDLIYPGQHLNLPNFIKKSFWQNVADVVTSFIPFVSDIRDAIETNTNKDLITGRALTPGEESLTGAGAMIPLAVSGGVN